jgi:O-succinylbenzoic acid--CoA ligase
VFIIKDITYSVEDLKTACLKPLDKEALEDWEYNFWNFINQWFKASEESIEIKTSGSTGVPKKISHRKEYMIASAQMTCDFFKLNKTKTALLCITITSVGGMMMIVRSLVSGMNLIIQKPSSNPLFNLNQKIDFVAMVPLQVQKSLAESKTKWSLVKEVIIGGGKVSDSLEKILIQNNITAYNTFGMTETISHVALKKMGSNQIFKGLKSCSFTVNENNCLIINAPLIGVKNLQTNDIVNRIDSTQFDWLGRMDNAIETGGIKVLPEKLEEKIAHLISTRFFLSSVSDKLLNNKLILLIEGVQTDFSLLDLNEYLSKYERPKAVYFLESFNETNSGKFSRKLTMEKFINKN